MVLADFNRAKVWTGLSTFDTTEGNNLAADVDVEMESRCQMYFYPSSGSPRTVTEYANGGYDTVELLQRPVIAINSVDALDAAGNVVISYPPTSYVVSPVTGTLKYRFYRPGLPSYIIFPRGDRNIRIVYTTGVPETDLRYKKAKVAATHLLCAAMFRQKANEAAVCQGGSQSYSVQGQNESFPASGPYAPQIAAHVEKAEQLISQMTLSLREFL